MNWKTIDRIVAGAVFAWALVLYLLTMAPTVSFWDSGEFIASVYGLQVMHPPGAPLYMLIGRFFSMFAPTDYVAFSVNLVSVLASAGTVLLTHLTIVLLVQRWQETEPDTTGQRIVALASGVVGALTFAATDSFWFNAVEAEVYALSMFFTAAVVWLIMRWSQLARREEALLSGGQHPFALDANRYLVLIAYLFGLAIGVHLLNLLAFFFIALIFFFEEFDKREWSRVKRWQGIVLTGAVASGIFFLIYPGIITGLPTIAGASGAPFFTLLAVVGAVVFGIYTTHKRRMPAANLAMVALGVILIGYSSYALIFVRSATEPHIDLNDPDTGDAFVSYLKREQYGSTPLLKGVTFDDATGRVDMRGEEGFFPRRHSLDPYHWREYSRYDSDWEFFWKYQVNHMYVRYFLWNFAGRANDVQDARAITGISLVDPNMPDDQRLAQTPSEAASRNVYYALPLLLGLFGAFYHFSRDWRRAFSVFVLFLVTGLGIIVYLNQPPFQPRERDYSYVASFFAFSLWVGIGAGGLVQLAYESLRGSLKGPALNAALVGVAALTFASVPVWMTYQNYDDHDRSGNYVARDYAYNMLNSVGENAILFTNGDNDTYPLWYLQEVEGVRRDVRVVNLSLLNTPWYIEQLKEEPSFDAPPVPIAGNIDPEGMRPMRWQPRTMELPVDQEEIQRFSEVYLPGTDSLQLESPMTWTLEGRQFDDTSNLLQVADQAAYEIILAAARQGWERPIYFATTVSPDGQLNLQPYFQLEGQARRVVPYRHNETALGRAVPELTPKRLQNFRFTNLDDPDVYLNENARNMIDAYRSVFSQVTEQLAADGYAEEAEAIASRLMDEMPFETVAGDFRSYLLMARAFEAVDNQERVAEIMQQAEPLVFRDIREAESQRQFSYALQYAGLLRLTYLEADQRDALRAFDEHLELLLAQAPYQVPNDVRRAYGLAERDSTGTLSMPDSATTSSTN